METASSSRPPSTTLAEKQSPPNSTWYCYGTCLHQQRVCSPSTRTALSATCRAAPQRCCALNATQAVAVQAACAEEEHYALSVVRADLEAVQHYPEARFTVVCKVCKLLQPTACARTHPWLAVCARTTLTAACVQQHTRAGFPNAGRLPRPPLRVGRPQAAAGAAQGAALWLLIHALRHVGAVAGECACATVLHACAPGCPASTRACPRHPPHSPTQAQSTLLEQQQPDGSSQHVWALTLSNRR